MPRAAPVTRATWFSRLTRILHPVLRIVSGCLPRTGWRCYNPQGRRCFMSATSTLVHCDPDILGGTPVFIGTRVPVRTLLDYLEAGDSLHEFLEDFPSVTREQTVAALRLAKQMLTAHANPA